MWRGKLPREIFEIAQQGYAAAEPVVYPEGVEVIDCGLGTNPMGMPESLCRFLKEGGFCSLCDYPEPEPEGLKNAVAQAHGSWKVSPDQVLVGSGSIGLLVSLFRILLRPGSVMAGVSPQFTDPVLQAFYIGASYEPVRLAPPRYTIEPSSLLEVLGKKPEVLYLDRPHNPTGQVLPLDEVARLALAATEAGTWVISDEAYGDFLPDEESAATLDFPNLVTCRSFSKGLGAAGIRVGYAVCRDPELAALFRKVQPPFAVGALDACMALAILGDPAPLEETRAYVRMAKARVLDAVSRKGGWAAADTDERVPILLLSQESGSLVRRLAAVGVSCEGGSGYFDLDDRSVRLRVPAPEKIEAFLERLAKA